MCVQEFEIGAIKFLKDLRLINLRKLCKIEVEIVVMQTTSDTVPLVQILKCFIKEIKKQASTYSTNTRDPSHIVRG